MNRAPIDPSRRPPPVKDRPLCPGCSRPLRPMLWGGYPLGMNQPPEPRYWDGTYQSYGRFCSLKCCQGYANFMFRRHGTMLVKKDNL